MCCVRNSSLLLRWLLFFYKASPRVPQSQIAAIRHQQQINSHMEFNKKTIQIQQHTSYFNHISTIIEVPLEFDFGFGPKQGTPKKTSLIIAFPIMLAFSLGLTTHCCMLLLSCNHIRLSSRLYPNDIPTVSQAHPTQLLYIIYTSYQNVVPIPITILELSPIISPN